VPPLQLIRDSCRGALAQVRAALLEPPLYRGAIGPSGSAGAGMFARSHALSIASTARRSGSFGGNPLAAGSWAGVVGTSSLSAISAGIMRARGTPSSSDSSTQPSPTIESVTRRFAFVSALMQAFPRSSPFSPATATAPVASSTLPSGAVARARTTYRSPCSARSTISIEMPWRRRDQAT
jgi:hypothetical protein